MRWPDFFASLLLGVCVLQGCSEERGCVSPHAVRVRGICQCPAGSRFNKHADDCEFEDGGSIRTDPVIAVAGVDASWPDERPVGLLPLDSGAGSTPKTDSSLDAGASDDHPTKGAVCDASTAHCSASSSICDAHDDRSNGECHPQADAGVAVPQLSVVQLSAQGLRTCALLSNGKVKCWGESYGSTPTLISGVDDAVELAVGGTHACARLRDGTVTCWGSNSFGQLGVLTEQDSRKPVVVPGLSSVVQVVSGVEHSCARTRGGVWCWGNGLGFDGLQAPHVPMRVQLADSQRELSAGYFNTCSLPAGGDQPLQCVGSGQKGENTGAIEVTTAAQVSIGWMTLCARLVDGQVVCWGMSSDLRAGSAISDDSTTPVVVPGLTGVIQVACGLAFSCARSSTQGVVCWGRNEYAQVGTGFKGRNAAPSRVAGLTDAEELALGAQHACARLSSGRVVCWGSNEYGELGIGDLSVLYEPSPTTVPSLP